MPQTMSCQQEKPTTFNRSHLNKSTFVKPRDVTLSSIVAAYKDASPSTREDKNVLNNAVRKVVEESGLRTVKGEAFNTCFEMLKKYIPNLSKDPDVLRHVRLLFRKNMNYRKNKEDLPADKPEPPVNRMPTDFLNFDSSSAIPDYLQCGSEVCLEYQGYPVCKAKVVSFPASIEGMTDIERNEFVLVQMTLKRRNTDVAVFPYKSEYRSWEKVGKGARFAWCVCEVKPGEVYDNFVKDKKRCQQKFTYLQKKKTKKNQPTEKQPDLENNVQIPEPEPMEPEPADHEVPEPADHEEPEPADHEELEPVDHEEPEPVDPVESEPADPVEPEPAEQEPELQELEMELALPQQHTEPEPDQRIQVSDYVEVSLKDPKRGTTKKFYGIIIETNPLEVKFLKDITKKNIKVWPQADDISIVDQSQIVRRLEIPTLDQRLRYVFVD